MVIGVSGRSMMFEIIVSCFQIYDVFQLLPANIEIGVFAGIMPLEALEMT